MSSFKVTGHFAPRGARAAKKIFVCFTNLVTPKAQMECLLPARTKQKSNTRPPSRAPQYPRGHPLLLVQPEWRFSQCSICLLENHSAPECGIKTAPTQLSLFSGDLPREAAAFQSIWLQLNEKAACYLLGGMPSDSDIVALQRQAGLDAEISVKSLRNLVKIFVKAREPQVKYTSCDRQFCTIRTFSGFLV